MTTVFARVWRRYWPLNFLAVIFFVVVVLFAGFLHHAQDRQRQGTCAILDRLPTNIDSGVDKARALYECGAPKPPILFFGHPFPKPTPTVKPHHVTRSPGTSTRTIVVVPGHTAGSSTHAPVKSSPKSVPASHPPVKPSSSPTSKPTPSTCVSGVICVGLLPQS